MHEVKPALFAALTENEAERAGPGNTLVDVSMIGAAGRLYGAGTPDGVATAAAAIDTALAALGGQHADAQPGVPA